MATPNRNIAPGYCIAQQPGSLTYHAHTLFGGKPTEAARFFMKINADTPQVLPGQMLIIADPANPYQAVQLTALKQAKARTHQAVRAGDGNFSQFLHRHYAAIAAFTQYGDTVTGLVTDAGERYYSQIRTILLEAGMQQNRD
ncbi:hypothetical protein [Serratia sp. FGI94]|uniref:hypothetical protein n=1 Tax=Serratia sp. FGI94 TaxID=671990 RepID=UPI000310B3A4|nr:hypothetical protein [Serratia sp. FGI94]